MTGLDIQNLWMQQSRVVDEMRTIQIQKACKLALDDGLDLEQIYEDQDSGLFH
jgi:hypothetical protein